MIWFVIVAGLLTVTALATILEPIIRQPRSGTEEEEPVATLFRCQLAAIDEELTEGRVTPDQAGAFRIEITRGLLAAANREPAASDAPTRRTAEISWRFGVAITIAGLLPAATIALYYTVGTPAAINRNAGPQAASPHSAAELSAAVDEIKGHLQTAPDDPRSWTQMSRAWRRLGRFPEAHDAFHHTMALAPANIALHAELGEALVLEAQDTVTPAAEDEFAKAPDDPRSRYYAAEAALQHDDPAAAKKKLDALLANAPSDAPWRQTVTDRLAELSQNVGAAPSARASGPTFEKPPPQTPHFNRLESR
jgi:cytochrome c-type biogenesis protein CcmH